MVQTAVLRTLTYFSIFQFPLTAPELYSNLWQGTEQSFFEFLQELESLVVSGVIQKKCGYFFLPGQEAYVEARRSSTPYVEARLKRAYRAARLIAGIPFLKAIFVCNSVAAECADAQSDIDFFIITTPGRAWFVRLFTNVILYIFRLRRHGLQVANRICLSFYIDEAHLDLQPLTIAADDIYLAYWLKQLVPLYDPEEIYVKLLKENKWQNPLIKAVGQKPFPAVELGMVNKFVKRVMERLTRSAVGDRLEKFVRALQQKRIAHMSVGKRRSVVSAVVATDGVLKFHEEDAREGIRQRWLQLCE